MILLLPIYYRVKQVFPIPIPKKPTLLECLVI